MSHWWVFSPTMSEMIPVTDDGLGPLEDTCEVVSVDAPTKREAIKQGVRLMKKWPQDGDQFWDVGFVPESVEMIAQCDPQTIQSAMRVIAASRALRNELLKRGIYPWPELDRALIAWDGDNG